MKRLKLFFPLSMIILLLDQWTKNWAITNVKGQPSDYFFGIFTLVYAENTGAWGNLGADWPPFFRELFLLYLPVIMLSVMSVYTLTNKKLSLLEVYAYCLIFAGGMGNIIDRFRFDYVVDFMYIGIKNIGTNIFNIADVSIMTGFGLILLDAYKKKKAKIA